MYYKGYNTMIKLFDVVQHKTNVKGFWIDKGKVYIDNVSIKTFNNKDSIELYSFNLHKQLLFKVKKQLAVFYIKGNKACIEDRQGNIDILSHCIRYKEKHISKAYIKALLLQHGGLTIYRHEGYYTIDIWKE